MGLTEEMEQTILLKGLGVSQGKVKGKVKIISNISEYHKFEEGDILVTKITNPGMVMLMGKASGIICDVGGMTSHPSIVSREMGIPCIVSTKCVKTSKSSTEILKDGMLIEMCGKSGEVYLIGDENAMG